MEMKRKEEAYLKQMQDQEEERNQEMQLQKLEMQRKEAAFQKLIEEQEALQHKEAQKEIAKREKKDIIMSIKADIEPQIIEANEIADNMNKNIKFELQFAGSIQDEGFGG